MNDLVYVMTNLKLTKKETRNREPLEFVDIESDDEFLTTFVGRDNNDDSENVQQPINVEESASHANDVSTNSLTPSLINLDCGPNIEDHL
jgi:hypothetical protein